MQDTQTAAAKAVRLHLAARHQTQTWLARQLDESPFWLSRRMTGAKTFNVEELDRIASVLGTTLDGLIASAEAIAS